MARGLGVLADAGILLGSTSGLLLLGMSISIISMVIFACVDNKARKRRASGGGFDGGGGCGGGGGDGGRGCGGGGGGCWQKNEGFITVIIGGVIGIQHFDNKL